MNINIQPRDEIQIVQISGELSGADQSHFVERVTNLLNERGTKLIIDLSGVSMMNSSGLGELVRVTAQANTQECQLVLAAPSPFVEGVLQTTRLDRFFDVAPTVDAAIATLRTE